jgi:hypothetical protein
VGILPRVWRADDSGCPKDAEEGNVVTRAPQSSRTPRRHEARACVRGTRPSLGPSTRARQSSLCTAAPRGVFVVRRSIRHHGWANPREREEPALGSFGRAQRGSPRVTALAREKAWHVRKGRRSRPPSLRGSRARVWLPARRCTLQKSAGDVWPRISSANALQKERSGSSERGPSSERWLAGQTVGSRVGRRGSRESASPLRRARIGARPTVARERHQRQQHRQKRCSCRGTGVVMATGSYEGYLLMEGTPGHHEASSFTRGAHGWSWRSSAPSDPCLLAKSRRPRSPCSSREGE